MELNILLLFGLLLLVEPCLSGWSTTRHFPKKIDDGNDQVSIEEIAHVLCESSDGFSKQLSRFSTIQELIDYLSSSSDLQSCWTRFGESLKHFQEVIKTGNEDACGETKLKVVEEFHRMYVSQLESDLKARKANHWEAPEILVTFFIHYAREMLRVCRSFAFNNLSALGGAEIWNNRHSDESEAFFNVLDKLGKKYDFNYHTEDLTEVFFLWKLVDTAFGNSDNVKFNQYVEKGDPTTSEPTYRVSIKMNGAASMKAVQKFCSKKLRPIYSRTILPIIRLIDLGYYMTFDESIPVEDWYKITQLCEVLLPIRVFEDSSLKQGKVVLLTKEEAAALATDESPIEPDDESENTVATKPLVTNSVTDLEGLHYIAGYHDKDVERWRANVKSRTQVLQRVVKNLAPRIKAYAESDEESFFLSKKGNHDDEEVEDIAATIGESVSEISKKEESKRDKAKKFFKGIMENKVVQNLSFALILLTSPLLFIGGIILTFVVQLGLGLIWVVGTALETLQSG